MIFEDIEDAYRALRTRHDGSDMTCRSKGGVGGLPGWAGFPGVARRSRIAATLIPSDTSHWTW